ncbi:MAG: ATP-binding protein [Solirubrobacterales bacterium]|nr:ATP-binding protein [Solirubrobacterales bacterium]MBV9473597.1 ATP-binding protein [Solirubrobacterales bacterium]
MRGIRELFPTDDPVGADMLVGRARDVAEVAERLASGTHIVIAGPRRTGKSTVGLAALARLPRRSVYSATVDLWDHEDLAGLVRALARAILANRGPVAKALRAAREGGHELRDLLPRGVTASLRTALGEDVELAFAIPPGRSPSASLAGVVRLAQRIAEKDDRRIVLFLDEFQDIAAKRFGDPDSLTKQLRAELQRCSRVSVLFAGSMEHLMRDLFGPGRRALSQFGSFHELSPILPSEWRAGIAGRLAELGIAAAGEVIDAIVHRSEGHPRTTMLMSRETVSVALSRRRERRIDYGDVLGGWDLAMQADRLRHEEIVQRLRASAHAYAIALRVARGQRPYTGTASAAARRALSAMEKAGIAERLSRGAWSIPEPLLREYLATRP